jgi:hypothetical protein
MELTASLRTIQLCMSPTRQFADRRVRRSPQLILVSLGDFDRWEQADQ